MVDPSVLKSFGDMEDGPQEGMVVRILGYNIGLADGWFHYKGGWSLMIPEFKPNPEAETVFGIPYEKHKDMAHMGLVIEFYTGQLALVLHEKHRMMDEPEVLWHGPLKVK
jgi:hypothetical protein